MKSSFFMLVKTTPTWLALTPGDRFSFLETVIAPILQRQLAVSMRFFDSEAFNARASDVVLWGTHNVRGYQDVVDALRETDFWGSYFDIIEIVPAIENAYAESYDHTPYGATADT